MKTLNVALPDVVTRVTEYIPEIIQYIDKIIQNGFAYSSNGSVYFSVKKFDSSSDHTYAKLSSESKNNQELLDLSEGALTIENNDKKNKTTYSSSANWSHIHSLKLKNKTNK